MNFFEAGIKGVPLDNDDAMFHPPVSSRGSHYEIPIVSYQEASPLSIDSTPPTPPSVSMPSLHTENYVI